MLTGDGLMKYFKSRFLTHETNTRLHKTLVEPVLIYGSKSWVITQFDKYKLSAFRRKTLRKIHGPVKERGQWKIRYNKELYQLYRSPDIITLIKIPRL